MAERRPRSLDWSPLLADVMAGRLGAAEAYRRIFEIAPPSPARAAAEGPRGECPICGTTAPFLPFGLAHRPGDQCPACGSLERHRLLWLFLRDRTDMLASHGQLLHIAPEPCLAPGLKAALGPRYVSLDRFDPEAMVAADLARLPFADGTFGTLLCSHVLEHLPEDRPSMAEIARVLAPGGRAILMVPYDADRPTYEDARLATPAKRLAAFGHPFHFRIYGRDLPERLGAAGLAASVRTSQALLGAAERRRYRINRNALLDCRRL